MVQLLYTQGTFRFSCVILSSVRTTVSNYWQMLHWILLRGVCTIFTTSGANYILDLSSILCRNSARKLATTAILVC